MTTSQRLSAKSMPPRKSSGSLVALRLRLFQLDRTSGCHLVDEPECLRFFRRHEMIAVQRSFDGFVGLTGVMHVNLIESTLDLENILGVPLDIRGLTLEPP